MGVVATQTPVPQTATVTYPGGAMALLNEVTTTDTSVTRTAIRFTSGPASGTIVGRVICGAAPYPLAVSAAGASGAASDLALTSTGGDSGPDTRVPLIQGPSSC